MLSHFLHYHPLSYMYVFISPITPFFYILSIPYASKMIFNPLHSFKLLYPRKFTFYLTLPKMNLLVFFRLHILQRLNLSLQNFHRPYNQMILFLIEIIMPLRTIMRSGLNKQYKNEYVISL